MVRPMDKFESLLELQNGVWKNVENLNKMLDIIQGLKAAAVWDQVEPVIINRDDLASYMANRIQVYFNLYYPELVKDIPEEYYVIAVTRFFCVLYEELNDIKYNRADERTMKSYPFLFKKD